MNLILKIAARNIWRHRGQSFVVGSILFLASLIMTLGNGVISGMELGLNRTVVHGFTGDIVLISDKQENDNVFMEMMGKAIEPIHDFPAIRNVLNKIPWVEQYLPVGKNMAMILNEDGGTSTYQYLIGVDFENYQKMFPGNLDLIEGKLPMAGRPALLLPTGARKEIQRQTNIWFLPKGLALDTTHLEKEIGNNYHDLSLKSSMVMMGFNQDNSASDLRLDVDGIFRYHALNSIFGNFALIDIESYRQCLGYFLAGEKSHVKISSQDSALFTQGEGNLDSLFSDNSLLAETSVNTTQTKIDWSREAVPVRTGADLEAGDYNLVLLLLKPHVKSVDALSQINQALKEAHLPVRAVDWKSALGPVGSIATLIKGALFLFVSFLFFVAVIIIVNTLSMAALERTSEIGMMRAIGARKGFISIMFLTETAYLALLFGGAGIISGIIAVTILPVMKISTENDMLQLFFGGDVFHPVLTSADVILALIQLSIVTLAAVLYPLTLVRKVTPLDAVNKE